MPEPALLQTRDQRLAAQIFQQVSAMSTTSHKKAYGSLCHRLPILIRSGGLCQALAFVDSRNRDECRDLLRHLGEVVQGDVLQLSRTEELRAYISLTLQIMAALLWYKRFAQSVLKVEASDDDESED